MGLREKARQGLLTGMLPWSYRKSEDPIAQPDPEKASYVRRLFEMYATGQHPDRVAERQRATHRPRARVRRGHRPRDALQRRLRRLRLRAPRHQQGDQETARADRRRDAIRPRATAPPPARPHPETRTALAQLPPARARALPPLRRTDAGHHRRPPEHAPLLLRHPPRR